MNDLKVWEPSLKYGKKYDIERFEESVDGLKIFLSSIDKEDEKLLLEYKCDVCSYKNTEESFWASQFEKLEDIYGYEFLTHHTFFRVSDSSYSKEIESGSNGAVSKEDVFHLEIIGGNAIIDIVSFGEPILTLYC